jgi:CRISPR system Cascade subunit CasD
VIGMLCCALGQRRSKSPATLAALKMHVRVDRQGTLLKDFQTAGGGVFRGSRDYFAPTSSGAKRKNPDVTERHYLQDALFHVALEDHEGPEDLLTDLAERLNDPRWPWLLVVDRVPHRNQSSLARLIRMAGRRFVNCP